MLSDQNPFVTADAQDFQDFKHDFRQSVKGSGPP